MWSLAYVLAYGLLIENTFVHRSPRSAIKRKSRCHVVCLLTDTTFALVALEIPLSKLFSKYIVDQTLIRVCARMAGLSANEKSLESREGTLCGASGE